LLRVTGEVRSVAQKHIDRSRVKGAIYTGQLSSRPGRIEAEQPGRERPPDQMV
jgi:hypothetical protein